MPASSFAKSTSGSISPIFAIALIPLLGFIGAAVDYSRSTVEREKLQSAVDSAALKAATSGLPSEAAQNLIKSALSGIDGVKVEASMTDTGVSVTATKDVKAVVVSAVGFDTIPIVARSTAAKEEKGPPVCILGLNRTASGTVSFSGNTSLVAKNCGVYSNSTAADALSIQGSAKASAAGFCSVGGATGTFSPAARTSCAARRDPFADLPVPDSAGCQFPSSNQASVKPNSSKTFEPGIYCETMDIKGSASFKPGVYVLKKGLSVSAQADAVGDGVTFYLTGSDATLTINGGGTIALSAPKTGDYKGVLFYQDRNVSASKTSKLNGNSGTTLTGAVYLPTQRLEFTGTGGFGSNSPFMPIIADQVVFSGNSVVEIDHTAMVPAQPLPTMSTAARVTK